ncbi:MAG: hypothetical protein ACK414_16095, partial [Gemmobacter sp.]
LLSCRASCSHSLDEQLGHVELRLFSHSRPLTARDVADEDTAGETSGALEMEDDDEGREFEEDDEEEEDDDDEDDDDVDMEKPRQLLKMPKEMRVSSSGNFCSPSFTRLRMGSCCL